MRLRPAILLLALACNDKEAAPTRATDLAPAAQRPAALDAGTKVVLPAGAAREIDPGQASVVVAVLRDGRLVVNGVEVTADDLDRLFRDASARDPDTQVIVRPDGGVPHGKVVDLMERARRAGLRRLAIATNDGAEPTPPR